MNDMEQARRRIMDFCRKIDFDTIENLLFTLDAPIEGSSHFMPRLNILLTGDCTFQHYRNGRFESSLLSAPAIYYCAKSGYQVLRSEVPRSSISFCYNLNHVRVVLVNSYYRNNRCEMDRMIYSTSAPLSNGGMLLINAVEQLYYEGNHGPVKSLLGELFKMTLKNIGQYTGKTGTGTSNLWNGILAYIQSHVGKNIKRSEVARAFGVSPGYISKLSRRYHHCDFMSVVAEYQMGHAAMLLTSSDLTIPEIAELAGFKYTSYFFRRFRKFYNMTPREYREKRRTFVPVKH
ncbi:MAG: helix-turn-helix transcriptional regulator [Lentisphaerae bacterium]|nr:helix-turn-helix transcriptional regulator [Lentisphaerota bacterium]